MHHLTLSPKKAYVSSAEMLYGVGVDANEFDIHTGVFVIWLEVNAANFVRVWPMYLAFKPFMLCYLRLTNVKLIFLVRCNVRWPDCFFLGFSFFCWDAKKTKKMYSNSFEFHLSCKIINRCGYWFIYQEHSSPRDFAKFFG